MSRSDAASEFTRVAGDDLLLQVRVQPRASRATIDGIVAGRLRLRVTAAPSEGEANAAVIELLAEHLDVPRSRLRIERGTAAREKTVRLQGGATLARDLEARLCARSHHRDTRA